MEEPLPHSDEFNIGFVRQHPPSLLGWHLPYPLLTLERGFKRRMTGGLKSCITTTRQWRQLCVSFSSSCFSRDSSLTVLPTENVDGRMRTIVAEARVK